MQSDQIPLRLHIGGTEAKPGWKILDIQARPGTDFVGRANDLSMFGSGSVAEIYASHVYEHLAYSTELERAFSEAFRVLRPGGVIRIGVPDMDVLSTLLVDKKLPYSARFQVMRMMFGGQMDPHDFHKTGFTFEILEDFLTQAGFRNVQRVSSFGLFQDATTISVGGKLISLNVVATKPA